MFRPSPQSVRRVSAISAYYSDPGFQAQVVEEVPVL